jgi:hypothetical protein
MNNKNQTCLIGAISCAQEAMSSFFAIENIRTRGNFVAFHLKSWHRCTKLLAMSQKRCLVCCGLNGKSPLTYSKAICAAPGRSLMQFFYWLLIDCSYVPPAGMSRVVRDIVYYIYWCRGGGALPSTAHLMYFLSIQYYPWWLTEDRWSRCCNGKEKLVYTML